MDIAFFAKHGRETWANEHHEYWYNEVKSKAR